MSLETMIFSSMGEWIICVRRSFLTAVSEVGTVSSAEIWLKSSLWLGSGSRCDASFTSEGRESFWLVSVLVACVCSSVSQWEHSHGSACYKLLCRSIHWLPTGAAALIKFSKPLNHTQLLGWVVCLYDWTDFFELVFLHTFCLWIKI